MNLLNQLLFFKKDTSFLERLLVWMWYVESISAHKVFICINTEDIQ